MEIKEVVKKVLDDYHHITGLRSYIVYNDKEIQSAAEKNYFCKCLKISGKALSKCEECTLEIYERMKTLQDQEYIYSCHAGLIKWAVPVRYDNFECMIISEGILAKKQKEDATVWTNYLSREYKLDEAMLLTNFKIIKTMNEAQMNASIELLKNLLKYNFALVQEEAKVIKESVSV